VSSGFLDFSEWALCLWRPLLLPLKAPEAACSEQPVSAASSREESMKKPSVVKDCQCLRFFMHGESKSVEITCRWRSFIEGMA